MRALVYTITICWIFLANAQTNTLSFFEALAHFENKSEVTFSYDTELQDLLSQDIRFTYDDLKSFIDEVQRAFPLEIKKVDDAYYTLAVISKDFQLIVKDSIDQSVIGQEFGVQVVINDAVVPTSFNDGRWIFNYKIASGDQVSVFSQGYKNSELRLTDLFNNSTIPVFLGLPTTRLNTVVVEDYLTEGIDLMPSRQSIKVDVKDLPLLPGETDGDIFASLSALPGVTNPDGRAGNLLIRGSETDQSLILFDNIPIYHRGHYYGTISPYNPKVVDNVQVYRGGFHPRLGDRVGGAVLIESTEVDRESSYGVGTNSLFAMAYANHRLNDKWSFSLGFRNSFTREVNSPKLEEISESVFQATSLIDPRGRLTRKVDVGFNDFNGKVMFALNDRNKFSLSSIRTTSEINFSPITPPDAPARVNDNRFKNTGLNFAWNAQLSNDWKSNFSLTSARYVFEFIINTLAPEVVNLVSENVISDFNVLQEFTKQSASAKVSVGIDYKSQEVRTNYVGQLRDTSIYRVDQQVRGNTIAPFANLEYFGFERWYFQLGLRSSYYSVTEEFDFSPRLFANYDISNRATLKGSFGFYNQYLSQVKNLGFSAGGFDNELWVLADDDSGFVVNGVQSMFGGVLSSNAWVFDVEGFYKTANNISVYEGLVLEPQYDFYRMNLELYGVDFLVKNQVSEAVDLWAGYSFTDSRLQIDTVGSEVLESKNVQPHVLYLGGAFTKNRWKLSVGWRAASGLYARSLNNVYAESTYRPMRPQRGMPPAPNPFDELPERYPSVYSLDLSASYKIPKTDKRWWSATFGFSAINATNRQNLTDQVFRSRDGLIDRNAVGFAPNLMVTFEW